MRTKTERRKHAEFGYGISSGNGHACANCWWYHAERENYCEVLDLKVSPVGRCNSWRQKPRRSEA